MSKKNYSLYDPDLAGQAFPKRFRELIERDGEKETVPKLKEALGVSSQAIKQYMIGTTYPKTENLIKIAQYFNCSLDYLIGLSDVQNVDADLQAVCSFTGLSENAVTVLHCNADYREKFGSVPEEEVFDTIEQTTEYPYVNRSLLDAVNLLIEHGYETVFFEMLLNYIYSNDLELIDSKGMPDYSLRYRNEKLSRYEFHLNFNAEQLEEFSFLMLQHALKDIRDTCAPDFEETLLGQRSKGMRMLFKEMQEFQESDTETEESE